MLKKHWCFKCPRFFENSMFLLSSLTTQYFSTLAGKLLSRVLKVAGTYLKTKYIQSYDNFITDEGQNTFLLIYSLADIPN